ncbi:hypothetical protein EZV62_020173 [Acer yangbiense]|uniref:Serine aminopeptidase S33 domain-containing protein n=1 Tax=Acer yangbiense TaxID=1000413 RepID=A0A5C7HDC2_9ROSI|nr:hypothetical protein EZV62_020173 [Acer yangbiense]
MATTIGVCNLPPVFRRDMKSASVKPKRPSPILKPLAVSAEQASIAATAMTSFAEKKKSFDQEGETTKKIKRLFDGEESEEYCGGKRKSLKDYFEEAKSMMIRSDGDQPRWFTPTECGSHAPADSPLLLYIPDLFLLQLLADTIFEICCLHIPVKDRTSFTGLVKVIERKIQSEKNGLGKRPIYLLGESIGACLALAVAARNPHLDLVLILANPGQCSFTCIYNTNVNDANVACSFTNVLADILPKETLLWKLELLRSSSAYANARLHAVKAQTLILCSGKDQLLPSQVEGRRLRRAISNCQTRSFDNRGHFLFLEDGVDLVSIIKCARFYRHGKIVDYISDFIPPSTSELNKLVENFRWFIAVISPVMLSTLEDGKIVRGLSGIPSEGPVLFVGNHMLLGFELIPMFTQFIIEKNIILRGISHPLLFSKMRDGFEGAFDLLRLMGSVPLSATNFYKLLSSKSHVILYPGGGREALHRKGEEYMLFWPERSEFVRMAAKFGAKIIPFGAVGEDDVAQLILDYNDQIKIPFIETLTDDGVNINPRSGLSGEFSMATTIGFCNLSPVFRRDMKSASVKPKLPSPILKPLAVSAEQASIAATPTTSFAEKKKSSDQEGETSKKIKRLLDVEESEEYCGGKRKSLKDYFEEAKSMMIRSDGDQPCWFTPIECGSHAPADSPLLLYIPGIDGLGLGLIMQQQRLGKIFEICCLHIPVKDRTSFTGLVKVIERKIKSEKNGLGKRPIYMLGESIGACLALAVAARNPHLDLVLILANPGDPFKMALDNVVKGVLLQPTFEGLSQNLVSMLSYIPVLADILPKETLLWKLELLRSASAYANARLHAVKAQTLILCSGKDQLLPSQVEGRRLRRAISNCQTRSFNDSGHFLFLEDGVDLVTIIKSAHFYRHGKIVDCISDFIPPSTSEFNKVHENIRLFIAVTSPVMLSTLEDGKIVRGLSGIPSEGPVLFVGNHMLLGLELIPMISQFIIEKNILLRGITHPLLFFKMRDGFEGAFDLLRLMGAVPLSATNFYKLLSSKSHVLMYPGGGREALHRKGEEYKLFWPEQSEFVRVAAKFGAKIIPFGAVGEDDVAQLVLDYNDPIKIPFLETLTADGVNINPRRGISGEVANQDVHTPICVPKVPGRIYIYFGKPIETTGRKHELRDRKKSHEVYLQVKSEVEQCLAFLNDKREHDPYRNVFSRLIYQATHGFTCQIPTFPL